MDREALALAQAVLLDVLERAPDGPTALRELLDDPRAAPLHRWLAEADPRMLGVAAALVRRWGRPDGGVAS